MAKAKKEDVVETVETPKIEETVVEETKAVEAEEVKESPKVEDTAEVVETTQPETLEEKVAEVEVTPSVDAVVEPVVEERTNLTIEEAEAIFRGPVAVDGTPEVISTSVSEYPILETDQLSELIQKLYAKDVEDLRGTYEICRWNCIRFGLPLRDLDLIIKGDN